MVSIVAAGGQGVPVGAERHRVSTGPVWPVRGWPSGAGRAGSVRFHNRTVSSALPAARVCPSGLNATETQCRRGRSGAGPAGGAGRVGEVPQPDVVIGAAGGQDVPVGAERHRVDTGRVAGQGAAQRAGWAGSVRFHSRIVSSAPPAARVRPSGLNATDWTAMAGVAGQQG